jgi:WD40 repeat protein/transcriptional regulator with XRE-family HTH domain
MDPSQTPESFRGLLLRDRGRAGLTQRELAVRAGISQRSVQDWEAGVTLPTAERLQSLIRALLETGGLTRGREMSEAREVWAAVEREGPRKHAPFDEQWFAGLLAVQASSESAPSSAVQQPTDTAERAQEWGEAPDTTGFVGRAEEIALLHRWVLDERSRVVAVLGMGGIGKTSLAARLAQSVVPTFARVYWRSVRNAPPASEWLAGAIAFLSDQQVVPPRSEPEAITALLQLLRTRQCLLVLDNWETLFEPGQHEARYRADLDGYGRVLRAIGETSHRSCLVMTSREAPPELAVLSGTCALELQGLGVTEAQALLADKHITGDTQSWTSLVERYGGNGLALRIVGETVRQVYAGDVGAFLADALGHFGLVFGGIRRLLDVQMERLSSVEREVLRQLAVEREPVSLAELSRQMAPTRSRAIVIEAVETLRRRSLVERGEHRATFTLQSLVLEYVTDGLVETAADEIGRGELVLLVGAPIIKAHAREYVRRTQERLIGTPILQQLTAQHGDSKAAAQRLLALLDGWRGRPPAEQGYAPGNIVNLLRLLRRDMRGVDLSRLAIRQAYLAQVDGQDARLVGAHLAESVLAEAFDFPNSVALSGDGALLAAGTSTGQVWLWRVADRTPVWVVHGHTGAVQYVALAGDGRLVASGGGEGTVRLWDSDSGRPVATLQGHTGGVWGVALSRDARLVASGSADGTVRLWHADTGWPLATLHGHTGGVLGVALSADAGLVASSSGDGSVRLWETDTGTPFATLQGDTGGVWGVALSGDGQLVVGGFFDGTVRLWDTNTLRSVAALRGHTGAVRGVALSADGRLVAASGSGGGTVRVWEAATGQPVGTLLGHTSGVLGLALSADGRLAASGSADGTVRLWETDMGRPVATLQGHAGGVFGVALSSDGRVVACGSGEGMVRVWEAGTGRPVGTLHGHSGGVLGVALSADGRVAASGSGDGTLRVWDTDTGQPVATLHEHIGGVWGVALSADGRLAASGSGEGTVRLWEVGTGRPLATLRGHTGAVRGVALSSDGRLLASGSGDTTVRVWDTVSGRTVATLHHHTGGALGVALSSDGRLLACGSADGRVRVWNTDTGGPVATLHGHTGAVRGVALSSDGRLLACGSEDGTVTLWEVGSGRRLASLQGHTGVAFGVALSADGGLAASGGWDGTVRLWDASTGACLRILRAERRYERMDITGLTGVTAAQRAALLALGAVEQHGPA